MKRSFATRVGEEGEWPDLPEHWSFSTLSEVESCPLRYALRHATYTNDVYSGQGYPDKVAEAALVGTVIHAAVEQVIRALRLVPDASDPATSLAALRQQGGYTKIIDRCVTLLEERLSSNPRMSARAARLGANLRRRTPEIRSAVQGLVARLPPSSVSNQPAPQRGDVSGSGRGRLALGRHPEARLRADSERFKGQVDLLTVGHHAADMVDFKSGRHDEHHGDQIVLYGLLWMLDTVANPDRLPVGTMTVAYAGSDSTVPHPSAWHEVEAVLRSRIAAADKSISRTPEDRLSAACTTCHVRHMCEAYWSSDYVTVNAGGFGDVEAEIVARYGALSWTARLTRTEEQALLRTTSEGIVFTDASTVRLLDVACERQATDDGALEVVVLTTVASSEMFEVIAH